MTGFVQSRWNRVAGPMFLLLTAGPAAAADAEGVMGGLELHAFISQGHVHTTANRFMGDSENGSFDFREIGASFSLRLASSWLVSAQVLSRKAGEMSNDSPDLDYALVDFTAHASDRWRAGLIAGRFKNPIGLYNDTRDVPFTRPSVFLPQSIYWEKLRDIMLSSDGAQGYAEYYRGRHGLFLQLGVGRLSPDENLEWAYLGRDWPGSYEPDGPSLVGRLLYELDGGRLRLALSGFSGDLRFDADPGALPGSGNTRVGYRVASFQYNTEAWSLTAEYMQEPVEWRGFTPPQFNNRGTADGYYLQGTWRPAPDWELLLRYDAAFLDRNDRDGRKQSARDGLPAHHYYSKAWSLGVTWQPTGGFMLRAQFDRVDGTAFLSSRENDGPAPEGRWNMLSLLVSLGF